MTTLTNIIDLDAFLVRALEQRRKDKVAHVSITRAASVAFKFAERCGAEVVIMPFFSPAYAPDRDVIIIPTPTRRLLRNPKFLATQVLHELAHWSGASSRLNRPHSQTRFDAVYNREELVAEITAVLLSFDLGITTRPILPNHKYLAAYLATLDRPEVALNVALSLAQQAAGYFKQITDKWVTTVGK